MIPKLIIWPKPGTYMLAVSGGVDSIVLLDIFAKVAKEKKYELIVVHFDHSMRPDSAEDMEFVRKAAQNHALAFESGKSKSNIISEADARTARYQFLYHCANKYKADGIITAQHQDDLVETSILNLARGSRRIGLSPFRAGKPLRPLKAITRLDILSYANTNKIEWREDVTNADTSNPRNFVRHILLKKAHPELREKYLVAIGAIEQLNNDIDKHIENIIDTSETSLGYSLPKKLILALSQSECSELILAIIRKSTPGVEIDRRLLSELVIFAKTAKIGKIRPIHKGLEVRISRNYVEVNKISK